MPDGELNRVAPTTAATTIEALLAIRAAQAHAGNRRNLFAAIDRLLAGAAIPSESEAIGPGPTRAGGETVNLTRLRLRNWKAFERADLVLAPTSSERPLLVIQAANGFGKSSLLEAFVLGLFGRRALSDIGFLMSGTTSRAGQRRSYRQLLERCLHRSDQARDEGIASVALDFNTAAGPISVERKWYFDAQGALIEDDEELLVRMGPERDLLDTPEGVPSREWFQEEIERRVMPAALAPFFVFDGEQVERWAERRLSEQVQTAVGRMLGLVDLRELSEDLLAYARDRERGLKGEPSALAQLRDDIVQLEHDLRGEEDACKALDEELATTRAERDHALARLASSGSATHAGLQGLLEAEHRWAAERHRLARELVGVVAEVGPLLMVHPRLRNRVIDHLDGKSGSEQDTLGPEELDRFWTRFAAIDPPLEASSATALESRFRQAFSRPEGATEQDAFGFLDRGGRRAVIATLTSTGRASLIVRAREALQAADRELADVRASIARQEQSDADRDSARGDLTRLASLIEEAESLRGAHRRSADALQEALGPKRAGLEEHLSRMREAEPRIRCASLARALAGSIAAHIGSVADAEYDRFGEAVTNAYRSLAHKDEIAKIEIGADGAVTLYDRVGVDLTDYRLSAGESQLFAMALIAAVGRLAGDRLPLIVDTPLGRLDTDHRTSVLTMLAERQAQTVLLVQPEEMAPNHRNMLGPRLAGELHLMHQWDPATGVGVSRFQHEPWTVQSEMAAGPSVGEVTAAAS